jgi:hypothetical protein
MKYHNPKALNILRLGVCLVFLAALPSCVHENTRTVAAGLSESRVDRMRSFYVQKNADDDHELGEAIASELKLMGYRVTAGSAELPSGKADAVITYTDKWAWDITMYMIRLDVRLQAPGSKMPLVIAKTTRTSLVRKSQQEMVRETLTKLLKKS